MRILLVDDDPVQRQLASVALRFAGQQVEAVHDVPAALSALSNSSFDVALLDHEMPVQSGLDLLIEIRRRGLLQSMPVIFVTSREDMALIDRAFELGASGFVTKPVNWALMKHELLFVLRAAANERLACEARDSALRLAATKEQLLNIARHELRTPLNAVIGFGRMVADSLGAGSPARECADQVLAAAGRLNSKLSDMMLCLDLDNGRIVPGTTVGKPAEVIKENLHPLQKRAAAAGIRLSLQDNAPDAEVAIDPSHLAEIVNKLVDNALVHGHGAKEITIALKRSQPHSVTLTVADDGAGIAPDLILHCLEAFTQGDMSVTRTGEGLGLGLHVAGRLAELYKGVLDLTSPGLG
ncbi:MAG: hybrid sensor histidine kinase/response regulator, partial [Methylocystis sp.]|nr:hybrid sensor histidine kinase/response regulator [Methylocystis sp.]